MQSSKFLPLLILTATFVSIPSITFAETIDNNKNRIFLHKSLDSSEDIVGNAVKGTGNVIHETRKTVKDIGETLGDTVSNNN